MKKYIIKDGDRVYATGTFLIRDSSAEKGWRIDQVDDDLFYDSGLVEYDSEKNEYFAEVD